MIFVDIQNAVAIIVQIKAVLDAVAICVRQDGHVEGKVTKSGAAGLTAVRPVVEHKLDLGHRARDIYRDIIGGAAVGLDRDRTVGVDGDTFIDQPGQARDDGVGVNQIAIVVKGIDCPLVIIGRTGRIDVL